MQPTNLTALDFEDIKSSIKSYLRTRDEFSDYDFEGSSLSYLVDALAYNTYYTSFNANMAMNEAFLPSSTVRDNVVNIAKLLNYVPRSIVASQGCVKFDLQTTLVNGSYPSTATLRKGAVATGGNYIWNILSDRTVEVDTTTGLASFDNVLIREGSLVTFSYTVNTFGSQTYSIPSADVDIQTLSVRVKPNESSTSSDLYNRVDTVTNLTPTTRAYFLSEGEDMRYEIRFGDDSVGRKLTNSEVILLEYLVTSGSDANGTSDFSPIGTFVDSNGTTYGTNAVDTTIKEKAANGAGAETIESIKYNAPRYYSAQYRAVTAQDYAIITKNIYANADSVVAYGGDSLNPPIYGKVFIAIKTKTGTELNDATKKEIALNLRDYAMASIDPVIVDPDNMYIYPKVFVTYDTGCGSNATAIKTNVQSGINSWASQTQINNFNSIFRLQQFEKAIGLSDKCVVDTSVQVSLLKYIEPVAGETNTYCVSTGSPLYDSNPSQDGEGCYKEPILLSGAFRTADRPGIDQYFEDDGFGKLRTFYNTGNKKVYTNNNAGTVNYETGEACFGPINIVGSGGNIPNATNLNITDTVTGLGNVIDNSLLSSGLLLPVLFIPLNNASIPATTPGTILNVVNPEVTVVAEGQGTAPSTIPLNSLTPNVFNQTPDLVEITPLDNTGALNTSSCF
ncbi:baseplate wedge subunit [Synechococcus phage S-8S29]|nr:baseplate wedge subunit [Synechococcus phage S-8S29]